MVAQPARVAVAVARRAASSPQFSPSASCCTSNSHTSHCIYTEGGSSYSELGAPYNITALVVANETEKSERLMSAGWVTAAQYKWSVER
jgi:hypothetical protein